MCTWLSQNVASAQQEKPFPTRQLTYMICFDPGGQSDRVARMQQPLLDKILKQKVIIDYKVGGGVSAPEAIAAFATSATFAVSASSAAIFAA